MNQRNMTSETRSLIALYFEGLTSLEQEERLRRILADPDVKGPEADEARAVMSFAAMADDDIQQKRPLRPRIFAAASIAASVTVIALIGWNLFRNTSAPECMAYVDGKQIDDAEYVMALINEDLDMLGEASENVSEEIDDNLSAFSSALKTTAL